MRTKDSTMTIKPLFLPYMKQTLYAIGNKVQQFQTNLMHKLMVIHQFDNVSM